GRTTSCTAQTRPSPRSVRSRSGFLMGSSEPDYLARNRAGWTKANAEYTSERALSAWSEAEITWGMCRAREIDIKVLPDFRGKDVVELGCGTGYFGAWLKRDGAARMVGVDITPAQLDTARALNDELGLGIEYMEANAEDTGLPSESFDLAVSEYGASIWCDPYKWIPEAARLLRHGGRLVFMRNSTLVILCSADEWPAREQLVHPQFGMRRFERPEGGVEFHLA